MDKRPKEDGPDLISVASKLITNAFTASLATNSKNGYPFVSWTSIAADGNRHPILLMSDLAIHTRNIKHDDRISVLLTSAEGHQPADLDDQLAQARLTLVGHLGLDDDQPAARASFLEVHPEAATYIDFEDFNLYRMKTVSGHLVAGFGRIVSFDQPRVQSLFNSHSIAS